jgi:hypothetical protein
MAANSRSSPWYASNVPVYKTTGVDGSNPNCLRTAAACSSVADSSEDPGAFSIRTERAPGSISRTVSWSDEVTASSR